MRRPTIDSQFKIEKTVHYFLFWRKKRFLRLSSWLAAIINDSSVEFYFHPYNNHPKVYLNFVCTIKLHNRQFFCHWVGFNGIGRVWISQMVLGFRIFITKYFIKMYLVKLIPILALVTCQLDGYDPFYECPWVLKYIILKKF